MSAIERFNRNAGDSRFYETGGGGHNDVTASSYGHWREHAICVIFEDIILFMSCVDSVRATANFACRVS